MFLIGNHLYRSLTIIFIKLKTENMKIITKTGMTFFLIGLFTIGLLAQIDQAKITKQFYTAYITTSNPAWKITLVQLADSQEETLQLTLAKGYYGAAGTAMGNQDEDLVEALLDKAATITKKLLAQNKKSPEANALLSAVYGMQMGLSPMKAMYLGSKSATAVKKGIELAPNNAFTNYVMGVYLFYTPSMFGGDAAESLVYFEKAKGIYETAGQIQSWEYMNLMAFLGQAYHSQKEYVKAKAIYTAALAIAPNFGYVKMYLLPQTEQAMKS